MNRTLAPLLAVLLALGTTSLPAASPQAGQMAPDFTLPDQTGRKVRLSDMRGGWVVLYFYPKDDTPGCTTQACELRDNIFAFRKAGATILGVSVDDVESHKSFAEENNLPFTLLADADKAVAKSYGVLTRFMGLMELARRETFLIDPSGRIARHYVKVDPKTHASTVLADLAALNRQKQAM